METHLPLLLVLFITSATTAGSERFTQRKCQEITIPMCKGIGYNMTYMPNQFNHDNQEEAGMEVHQFWPLVEIQCSRDLQFFLCSIYTPICVPNYYKPLPSCRSVCERAKSGCAPLMRQYGFIWPERMKCEELPEYGDKDNLCMDFNTTNSDTTTKTPITLLDPPKLPFPPKLPGSHDSPFDLQDYLNQRREGDIVTQSALLEALPCNRKCGCWSPLYNIEQDSRYYNKVSTGEIQNCAMNCEGAYFSDEARKFVVFWIGSWSILCFISTFLTVLTFLIDMKRFEYPERPIIFLSACYLMISIGYIIRLIAGHPAIACEGDYIKYNSTGPALCTVVFLLIYFFGMASSLWWVILSFTWFLAAGLKWGQEAIDSYSQYFHLAAWIIPSIKTITILATSRVDGDHIAGICYVGNQDLTNLQAFVIAPLVIYLAIGTSFLLAGFVSLFRIRDAIRQQGQQRTEKLEKLMIRIGVFSVLYTVPATVVIACYFYEQHFRQQWERTITCPCNNSGAKPDYSVFMLKYFMCLVVGITSGFWIWSSKTITTWRNLCCCKSAENKTKYSSVSYTTTTTTTLAPNGSSAITSTVGAQPAPASVKLKGSYSTVNHPASHV